MAPKKKSAKMEVVMTCKCGWKETPHGGAQIPLRCMKCGAAPKIKNAPYDLGRYLTNIEVLIGTLKTNADHQAALSNAIAMAAKVQSPFAISIRARKKK